MRKIILIYLITFVLCHNISFAACGGSSPNLIAASCNNNITDGYDVQDCLDIVVDGDTVSIPAGFCTSDKTWGVTDNNITIQGAELTDEGEGVIEGLWPTVIAITGGRAFGAADIDGIRITRLEFNIGTNYSAIYLTGVKDFRVDHCEIDFRPLGSKQLAVEVSNRNYYYTDGYILRGLVDNNYFYDANVAVIGSAYALNNGHAYHSSPLDLGGPGNVYFEDNYFESAQFGNLVDSNRSGGYVMRFNTLIKNGNQTGYVFEAHTLQSYVERGTKKWEIYKNTVTLDQGDLGNVRSGTGVVFGNTFNIGVNAEPTFRLSNGRDSTSEGIMGMCDGTHPDYDGQEDGGWLCRDQVGSGSDQSPSDGTVPYPVQDKVPAYMFDNTGSPNFSGSTNVQEDRDWFEEGGTIGVSVGFIANIPSTCTTGQGYWATDEGEWNNVSPGYDGRLYKCTATNTWTLYYTPYTYPHPLRAQYHENGAQPLFN